jgi:cellulose biosynthesis protein BcsQ
MANRNQSITGLVSARPDGGTSLACALAATLAASHRVLLVDLADRPEVPVLLDIEDPSGLNLLMHQLRVGPISPSELEAQVQWHDGFGVLAGSWLAPAQPEVRGHLVDAILAAAIDRFDHVVVDIGRPRLILPTSLMNGVLVWVVAPGPLGMAAMDTSVNALAALGCPWQPTARVVLNRVTKRTSRGVERLIEHEYEMRVAGRIPDAPRFWQAFEHEHSLRALNVPMPDRRRFERSYGTDALITREAVRALAETLLASPTGSTRRTAEGVTHG